ncbi:hypothetical protein CR513_39105, partial [Mucuna pruriens]
TKAVPLPFPTRTVQARNFKLDEELLQTFRKFLKELCTHNRKKLKGDVKIGRNVFALIKSEQDQPSSKGSTLIPRRPFLMTARTKIDVHARTFSMEFGDNMVQFNIFEDMKHLTENHFVFDLDVIDVLVDDYMKLHSGLSAFFKFSDFANYDDVVDLADNLKLLDTIGGGSLTSEVICRFILHRKINIRPPSHVCLAPLPTLGCRSVCATPQAPSRVTSLSDRGLKVMRPLPRHLKHLILLLLDKGTRLGRVLSSLWALGGKPDKRVEIRHKPHGELDENKVFLFKNKRESLSQLPTSKYHSNLSQN